MASLKKTTKYDYIRATLESIAYQTTDIIYSMKNDTKLDVRNLYVNGGVSTNNYLIQFQSNISGIDIYRQNTSDADLRGVGFLTGLAVGFWDDLDEIKRHSGQGKLFTPEMPQTRRRKLYRGWQRAIRAVREYTNDID
ncbi:FGGY-family carbohydrate kinase [Secundilactobacillus silagei]|uniref:FGGY-family carbohydrate kinase n=1 Tax=Secundilactobacillus silagei TaxID=1293415 RepID=UPI000A7218C0|nr:FGGY-family carbohydrate kinase [Secundilactobacillus silagei]